MTKIISIDAKKDNGKLVRLPFGVNAENVAWNDFHNLKEELGEHPYKIYDTVADMKNDVINLSPGKVVRTLGYYNKGDGGGAEYEINVYSSAFSERFSAKNSLIANMIIPVNKIVSALQVGIKKDGTASLGMSIKEFLKHNKDVHALYFPKGVYTFPNEHFTIDGDIKIIGDGCETIFQSQRTYIVTFNGNAKI